MRVIEYRQNLAIRDYQLSEILKRRLGERYRVQLGEAWNVRTRTSAIGDTSRFGIITVQSGSLFRVNVQLLDRPGLCLSLSSDVASRALYYCVFWPTLSLGYIALMWVAWLVTRGLERRVFLALAPTPWDEAARADLAPLEGPNGGAPRIYSGHRARQLANPLLMTIFDVARTLAGLALVIGLIQKVVPQFAWQFERHLYVADFAITCVAFGIGLSMLITGAMALLRHPLGFWKGWGLAAVSGGVFAVAIPYIVSPMFWRAREQTQWNDSLTSKEDFTRYLELPARYKRPESYARWLELLHQKLRDDYQRGRDSSVDFSVNVLLGELDARQTAGTELADVRTNAAKLRWLTTRPKKDAGDLPREYFEAWADWFEQPNEPPHRGRIEKLLRELRIAHPGDASLVEVKDRLAKSLKPGSGE